MKQLAEGRGKGAALSSPRCSGGAVPGSAAPVGLAFLAGLAVGLTAKDDQPPSQADVIHLSLGANGSEGGCEHDQAHGR